MNSSGCFIRSSARVAVSALLWLLAASSGYGAEDGAAATLQPAEDLRTAYLWGPTITTFSIPSPSGSLKVTGISLVARSAVPVTGYYLSASGTTPALGARGWAYPSPTSYTFSSPGTKTLYAWAKDSAGRITSRRSAVVTITAADTTPPTVTGFTLPSISRSLTVSGISVTASDNVGVSGYLLTQASARPAASAEGWSGSPPGVYTFASAGIKTLYAWAKDAAGNVSAGRSATVTVSIADTTAPVVTAFTIPESSGTFLVSGIVITAVDAVGVTGYLITESSITPAASAMGWKTSSPTSYTCTSEGEKTLYAWARDAAGNVSQGVAARVTVTLEPWELTFSDEFNGTELDLDVWQTMYPWGGRTNNDELEGYADDAFSMSNGALHIRGEKRTVTLSDGRTYNYTSGLINNSKVFAQTFGYFEMRADIPTGNGFWPAFWLLPLDRWPPEIDVMEVLSSRPTVLYMNLHWGTPTNHQSALGSWNGPDLTTSGFHVYAAEWSAERIIWYLDGVERYRIEGNPNIPALPMYAIANLAIGGSWGGPPSAGTVFPAYMHIDYIRIWQRSSAGTYRQIPGVYDPIPTAQIPLRPARYTGRLVSTGASVK